MKLLVFTSGRAAAISEGIWFSKEWPTRIF